MIGFKTRDSREKKKKKTTEKRSSGEYATRQILK